MLNVVKGNNSVERNHLGMVVGAAKDKGKRSQASAKRSWSQA